MLFRRSNALRYTDCKRITFWRSLFKQVPKVQSVSSLISQAKGQKYLNTYFVLLPFALHFCDAFFYNRKLRISYYRKTRFKCLCEIFGYAETHIGKQSVITTTTAYGERHSRFVLCLAILNEQN